MTQIELASEPADVFGLRSPRHPAVKRAIRQGKAALTAERLQRCLDAVHQEVVTKYATLFNWLEHREAERSRIAAFDDATHEWRMDRRADSEGYELFNT
jgi:hypothetical protein